MRFKLPDIGEGVAEGEVIKWHVSEGDEIEEDDPLVEVMTDKATVEIPSPVSGRVSELRFNEGDIVEVGQVLVVIGEEGEEAEEEPEEEKEEPTKPKKKAEKKLREKIVPAAPATRRLAREMGVDLSEVTPTGPGGRVTKEDMERFAEEKPKEKRRDREEEHVPLRGIRRRISEKMTLSKRKAAHVTHVDEVDVTELVDLRETAKDVAEKKDIKLTYLPFIIKALIPALRQHPYLNSSLDEEAEEIVLKKYYNIGIATATDKGLVVPVVKNADQKGIMELAKEIEELTERAREGKTKLEDLQDGTFSVTNIGALGGMFSTPIINHPEVAILGVHRISKRPKVVENEIKVRHMTYLALTFDHRVVDGDVAASFTNTVIRYLETPNLFLVEML